MRWLLVLVLSLSILLVGCGENNDHVEGKVVQKIEKTDGFEFKSLIVEYPIETGKTVTYITTEMNISYELFEYYDVGDTINISPDGSRIVKD